MAEHPTTPIQVGGSYKLVVVDDSNESWSRPEWSVFGRDSIIRLLAMALGTYLMLLPSTGVRDYFSIGIAIFSSAAALQTTSTRGKK